MLFRMMRMELNDIKLSDVSHTEKEKCCMILLICEILKKLNPYKQRIEWWLPGVGCGGNGVRGPNV